MEYGNGQQRRVRPDDGYGNPHPQASRVPRPHHGPIQRPPVQLSAPPRPYQHRPGPQYPHARPLPAQLRRPDDRTTRTNGEHGYQQPSATYDHIQDEAFPPPPPNRFQPHGRHFSHISALSSSQPAIDSRPISEVDSEYVAGPTFDPRDTAPHLPTQDERHQAEPSIVRQASMGKKARPTMTTLKSSSSKKSLPLRDSETLPSEDQAATMAALTAAIKQGLGPGTPNSHGDGPALRMPFQGDPESPTSVYTEKTGTHNRDTRRVSSYKEYDRDSKPSTIAEHDVDDYEKSNFAFDLPTPMSHKSTHPIVADEKPGMSAKIPPGKRPPKLNMDIVREAEARGSMTSLSDLIKRATRLASNLDRGRTASRMEWFGSSEKLSSDNNKVRDSTYSDVLNAFPQPDGTGTPGRDRPTTMWPNGEKAFMASKSSLGRFGDGQQEPERKPRRKCCGMSPPVFVLVLIIVILLIAAAVLVPVFLIVLPKQRHNSSPAECPSTHQCQNGGVSVVANDLCSCICVDGFTGSDCTTEQDPECISATLTEGENEYKNATVGSSVMPLLNSAKNQFNIALNTTNILSTFAYNNLSCSGENSLIDFGASSTSAKARRFVMLPGMISSEPHVPALNLPASESKENKRFVIVDGLEPAAERLQLVHVPMRTLQPRQDATQSANGIVYATSNDATNVPAESQSSAPSSGTGIPTATSASPTPSATKGIKATDAQLDFAATVVLYVLQDNPQVNVAVAAHQAFATYLETSDPGNSTVEVSAGSQMIQADFDKLQIIFTNGTTTGASR